MNSDFDEFGDFVGSEYSSEASSIGAASPNEEEYSDVEVENFSHDTQAISVPLVGAAKHHEAEVEYPPNWEFQQSLLVQTPSLCRNIAISGPQGHGKSAIIRFLGCPDPALFPLEKQREITLIPKFYSLLTSSSIGKSYVLNLVDLPGHEEFANFAACIAPVTDGKAVVIDAVETYFHETFADMYLNDCSLLIITKIDRLIVEQKLTPKKAAERLLMLAKESKIDINRCVFCSTEFNTCFTLESIADLYTKFGLKTPDLRKLSAFTEYVLTPIYKLVSAALVGPIPESLAVLETVGITVTPAEWKLAFSARIALVLQQYMDCNPAQPLIDALIQYTRPAETRNDRTTYLVLEHERRLFSLKRGANEQKPEQFILNGTSLLPLNASCLGSFYFEPYAGEDAEYTANPISMLAIEPLNATIAQERELVRILDNLTLKFPGFLVKPLESGEYELYGDGEMHFDTILHELKAQYSGVIKVGQLISVYKETATGHAKHSETSENGQFSIEIECVPIDGLNEDETVVSQYKSNLLVSKSAIEHSSMLSEGFEWSCIQGPLMGNEVCNVKFVIVSVHAKSATSQILPTTRRACQNALLRAAPRVCAPYSRFCCLGPLQTGKHVYKEIEKRGGEVVLDEPVPQTSLYWLEAVLPTIDTFTLGVDVKCQLTAASDAKTAVLFTEYRVVDEDPLSAEESYAREVFLKTRLRRNITDT